MARVFQRFRPPFPGFSGDFGSISVNPFTRDVCRALSDVCERAGAGGEDASIYWRLLGYATSVAHALLRPLLEGLGAVGELLLYAAGFALGVILVMLLLVFWLNVRRSHQPQLQ